MRPTLRIHPAKRQYPQEFYRARGLAMLLSQAGRHAEAAAVLRLASRLKRAG